MHLAAAATSTDRREEKGDPVLRLAVAVSAVLVQSGAYSGWWCVGSDEDTFLTAFGSQDDGGGLQTLIRDRQCARTAAEAVVVGDLATGQWTKGGGLMGDAKVGDEFPVAQLSAEG